MRRKEKEITDLQEIEGLLRQEKVCRFAMCDGDAPYVLPTTYGYRDGRLYIHSSREGRKIDVLKKNPRVSFVVDTGHELVQGPLEESCRSTVKFKSVIGTGMARFVEDLEEKRKAMDIIMAHQFGRASFGYRDEALRDIAVIRVDLDSLTGKRSGY